MQENYVVGPLRYGTNYACASANFAVNSRLRNVTINIILTYSDIIIEFRLSTQPSI